MKTHSDGYREIEGVRYWRFRVRFRLADGRVRVWTRWSPGFPWIREEIARELEARGLAPEDLKPHSCTIRQVT